MNKLFYRLIVAVVIVVSIGQLSLIGNLLYAGLAGEKASAAQRTRPTPIVENDVLENTTSFVPERIVIRKADIDLPVVSVPLDKGTWEVVPAVANYAEGTSLVNEKSGNVGIYGHDRVDAFTTIRKLESGDEIDVYGKNYKAIYTVDNSALVETTAVDVFYPTEKPTLTLITCNGIFSEKRLAVKAVLKVITEI